MKKILLIICAALLMIGCSNEPPVEVTTAKVSINDALTLTHDGKISTSDALKIFSPISGNVTEKYVEDGSDAPLPHTPAPCRLPETTGGYCHGTGMG